MNSLNKSGRAPDKPVPVLCLLKPAMTGLVWLSLMTAGAHAQQQSDGDPGLKLPEDLAASAHTEQQGPLKNPDGSLAKYQIEETRSGGRLERVTVKRPNGPDEVYENKNIDSMFSRAENEIGEMENVRRWTIGSW